MTITDRPTAGRGVAPTPTTERKAPMTSLRKSAFAAGLFYVISFVSIPTLFLYGAVHDAGWILGTGPDTPVLIGGISELIVGLAGIGSAVALYPVVKRQNEGMALGFVASRTLEASTIFVCVAALFTLVSLRQSGVGADGLVTGQALVSLYDKMFLVGQSLIPAINGILIGTLMYRSRLVPRWLPVLGFVGATLLIVSFFATVFDLWGRVSVLTGLFALPIAVWEFSFGVYMMVKGFKPSPITADMDTTGNAPVRQHATV
jgi:Domain of unknown function (DUF4386)